jgi:VanZ family protein
MARGTHRYVYLAFVAYLAFVVYGSLLPFELRDLSFPQALQAFADIRFLDLDVASRADWIANIVLYIPLAFLGCTWAAGTRRLKVARSFAIGLVFVFCVSIAVTIEFTQLFFAPRTVSLNDLLDCSVDLRTRTHERPVASVRDRRTTVPVGRNHAVRAALPDTGPVSLRLCHLARGAERQNVLG